MPVNGYVPCEESGPGGVYCKRIAFLSTSAAGVRSVSAMPPAAQVLIKATSFTTAENTNYKS